MSCLKNADVSRCKCHVKYTDVINVDVMSDVKFLARTNYLPLNERLFKINLHESSKCNICDDDIVEDLHHFLFECKTLRGIRQELFEEIETVIKSFYPNLAFLELLPFQKL
jgi:RNA processing factor Prp31